jgi:hypothetical protein
MGFEWGLCGATGMGARVLFLVLLLFFFVCERDLRCGDAVWVFALA